MAERGKGPGFWLEDKAARAILASVLALPYETRVRVMGRVMAALVAPLAGYRTRVRDNLAHAWPELSAEEVRRLERAVPNNVGRALIESYSGRTFVERFRDVPIEGPGAEVVAKAHAEGRPVVCVTGHFGNYDAARAAFVCHGYRIGALYNPMKNAYFNAHYEKVMAGIGQGQPVFARGRRGLGELVRHLRSGGMAALVIDQYMHRGEMLRFFGQPAPTALSAAELALKHNAPCVPVYGIRQPNGLDFQIVCEDPIPPGDPRDMTQALNDSLEARVRAHPEQWFWVHRRWKPERHATHHSAATADL